MLWMAVGVGAYMRYNRESMFYMCLNTWAIGLYYILNNFMS